jgi:hypothetical protein
LSVESPNLPIVQPNPRRGSARRSGRETTPPVTASPCSCVSRFRSPQVAPPCASRCGPPGPHAPLSSARVTVIPPWVTALPATLCPRAAYDTRDPGHGRDSPRHDIRRAETTGDQRRPLVDEAVYGRGEHPVGRVLRTDQLTREPSRAAMRSCSTVCHLIPPAAAVTRSGSVRPGLASRP